MSGSYLHFWQKNPRRNLWQHPIWGKFQESVGRKTWLEEANGASALVIKHNLPFGLSWLEIPRGPLWQIDSDLSDLFKKIKEIGKKENAIFVRMSPYDMIHDSRFTIHDSRNDHHPETSLVLDLQQSEEELLNQMKPKGRYNIKVSQKHGVIIESSEKADDFYELLERTAGRDGFSVHPLSHYQKMLESMSDNAQLLLAKYEGKIIAGGIFVYLDEWGIYYYGASDDHYRNVMAPYLIQWEAVKEAKKRDCRYYDFLGIAPENSKNHPWQGVTEFKKKFGGKIANYPRAKEMVLKPVWYFLYRVYKLVTG